MTADIPLRRGIDCRSGIDPLMRPECAEEEVHIARDAKRMLIGLAIIVAAFAVAAVYRALAS